VRWVEDGGAAARAGIEKGDLIVSAGGEPLARVDDLQAWLDAAAATATAGSAGSAAGGSPGAGADAGSAAGGSGSPAGASTSAAPPLTLTVVRGTEEREVPVTFDTAEA
jgi:S1-C subfamily serine protease